MQLIVLSRGYNHLCVSHGKYLPVSSLSKSRKDRQTAIDKMRSALGEVNIDGITTNLDYQYDIITHPVFQSGNITTSFIENYFE